jgi:DNA-binding transcriptional regulator YdaS (Cro superfamily)
MTPTRLDECLALIGWTYRGLAKRLGLHETRVRRWANGVYPVPANVADWLECLAEAHRLYPLPEDHLERAG